MKNLKTLNIRLFHDYIITTLNVKKVSASGIILTSKESGEILTKQTVLACGPNAMVSIGEEVEINTGLFKRKNTGAKPVGSVTDIGPDQFEVVPPIEVINGTPYLFITSREIKYVYIDLNTIVSEQPAYEQLLRGDRTNVTADKPC